MIEQEFVHRSRERIADRFGRSASLLGSGVGGGGYPCKAVITKGKEVVGVVHLGRRPNGFQKTALDWLYPTCAVEGCGVRTDWCETDHREPWAETRFTVVDLLDRLCRAHHKMKTNEGWGLVEGKGKRPFVPPQDPRHPRFNTGKKREESMGKSQRPPSHRGAEAPDGDLVRNYS